MEPWPLSHGYFAPGCASWLAPSPFNGAMASQPWIRASVGKEIINGVNLQCIHGLSAMDTPFLDDFWSHKRNLQWSHDLSAMDT